MANNACSTFRYVAICHPFTSHTMSKLSRAVKFVIAIWLLALCLAVPQAVQFGIVYDYRNGSVVLDSAQCSIKWYLMKHAFEISTMLFFVLPMTIITVLYILIAIKLRRSRLLSAGSIHGDSGRGNSAAQRNVIRMLCKWNVSLILYLFPSFFFYYETWQGSRNDRLVCNVLRVNCQLIGWGHWRRFRLNYTTFGIL